MTGGPTMRTGGSADGLRPGAPGMPGAAVRMASPPVPARRPVLTVDPSLPLNRLRAFEASARLGSISRAGDELAVTAGAVSRHIRVLEAELGVSLLERDGRGVRLTDDGVRLYRSLEPAFDMIAGAVRQVRRDPHRTRLTVMTVPVFASTWLLPRLAGFGRRVPEVDLVITDRITEEAFGASAADVVIDWGDSSAADGAVVEKLTDELFFPVCAPSAGPQDGDLDRAVLLHRHHFPRRYGLPDWPAFLAAVGRRVADPHAGLRVTGGLIMDVARTGNGLALATRTIAHDDLAAGRLVRPVAESMEIANGYWLLVGPAAVERPEVQAFCAWLREELAGCFGARPASTPGAATGGVPAGD